MVRLILFGRQGAGKGTQATMLSKHYGAPHISTGDMLREAAAEGTDFGRKAKEYMDAGALLPDDIMIGVIAERLARDDVAANGFVLDGFPRTVAQAEALWDLVEQNGGIDAAVNIEVPEDVVIERISSRRVCTTCGAIYSTSAPPSGGTICDKCGGEVVQREDDTPEAVSRRLAAYRDSTEPAIEWFGGKGALVTVDGLGAPDEVNARLVAAIDSTASR